MLITKQEFNSIFSNDDSGLRRGQKMKGTAPFLLDVVNSLQHSARTGSIVA
jgi:hypothetical protein